MTKRVDLNRIWSQVLAEHSAQALVRPGLKGAAKLYWGKAAQASFRASPPSSGSPYLVIYPGGASRQNPARKGAIGQSSLRWIAAEHPLPGPGSFLAGHALLEFFDELRRTKARRLEVYLSGGASSLAWLPPPGVTRSELLRQLEALYREPLSIEKLNAARSKLCILKNGGAARCLRMITPATRVHVTVISDVSPFDVNVVGSGPFYDRDDGGDPVIPHRLLADNLTLIRDLSRAFRHQGEPVLFARGGVVGPALGTGSWVAILLSITRKALNASRRGVVLLGGEPYVRVPSHAGRGGRQSLIACALLRELLPEIERGQVEVLCSSTDGSDGSSGGSGAWITHGRIKLYDKQKIFCNAGDAIERFDTGNFLNQSGMLLPILETGTNLQDVAMIRIR